MNTLREAEKEIEALKKRIEKLENMGASERIERESEQCLGERCSQCMKIPTRCKCESGSASQDEEEPHISSSGVESEIRVVDIDDENIELVLAGEHLCITRKDDPTGCYSRFDAKEIQDKFFNASQPTEKQENKDKE